LPKTKARWDQEELFVMASEEARLIRRGITGRTNQTLANLLKGNRTFEAVKSCRAQPQYKAVLKTVMEAPVLGSPSIPPASNVTQAVHPVAAAAASSGGDSVPWELALREVLSANFARGLFSFSREVLEELLSLSNGSSPSLRSREAIDLELVEYSRRYCSTRPRKQSYQRNVPIQTSKRVRRREQYARIQAHYGKNRGECAKMVLEGSWDETPTSLPLEELEPFWRSLFETASKTDTRKVEPIGPILWGLLEKVTKVELEAVLRSTSVGAAGPDNVTMESVKALDPDLLSAQFNLWLLAGYQPAVLREGWTVLIPKNKTGPSGPEEHRPITIGSCIGRVFHKLLAARMGHSLPLSCRQKGFRKGDGLAENVFLMQALIKDHTGQRLPLCVTFIDVRKAFDSVSCDSLLLAAKRLGVPDHLVTYLRTFYTGATTVLRVGGRDSGPIVLGRGVRQGDPLSPILFNCVIDWVLADLHPNLGVTMGKERLTHVAFADDLGLVTSSDVGMKAQLGTLVRSFERVGLAVNEKKSASLRIQVDGKRRSWVCNPTSYLTIGSLPIPAMTVSSGYKYLGVTITATGTKSNIGQILSEGLTNLSRAPLKPQQRLFLLKVFLIPKLLHQLAFTEVTGKGLKDLDIRVRKAVRGWMFLPHDTSLPYFHAAIRAGGLGIVELRSMIPCIRRSRLESLRKSKDPVIISMLEDSKSFASKLQKVHRLYRGEGRGGTKSEVASSLAHQLHTSVDGRGLSQHPLTPAVHGWVGAGTKLQSGRAFVHAIQARGNLLATPLRAARGRPNTVVACQACGRIDSLSHELQVCPKTSFERNRRHDRVKDLIAKVARKRGHSVLSEQTIRLPGTLRRPDLIVYDKGKTATVVDITIIADNASLSAGHLNKVVYYDLPGIRDHVASVAEVLPGNVGFSSVTLNWRGAMAIETDTLLSNLGFSLPEKQLVSLRVVEHAYVIWTAHHKGTWRPRRK